MVWFLDFQEALKRRVLVCFIKFSGTKFILCELCVPNMNLGPFIWYENIEIIIKDPFQSSWYWSYLAHFPAPSPKNKKKNPPQKNFLCFSKKNFSDILRWILTKHKIKNCLISEKLRENTEKCIHFSVPIQNEVTRIDKNEEEIKKSHNLRNKIYS